jgi:hypothetical protein
MYLHNAFDSCLTADIFFEFHEDKPGVVTKKRGANSRQTIRENIYEENAIPLFPINFELKIISFRCPYIKKKKRKTLMKYLLRTLELCLASVVHRAFPDITLTCSAVPGVDLTCSAVPL